VLDPVYEWDNTANLLGLGSNVATDTGRMIANRDWYSDNSNGTPQAQTSPTTPFNGSSGVGFGTLANRPTTCTPGVGYWARDQGNWNQSSNGFGQGQLFVCTTSNTWSLYYTPYTYPHPLTQSGNRSVTPTLSQAAGKVGTSSGFNGRASNFQFWMDAGGWPRAVTAGESIFMMGSWPNGQNPTMTDDKSNPWAQAASCNDSTNLSHGIFYAANAAANTSILTASHPSQIGDELFDWAHFYNMSTTANGFVDGSSCRTGVTPSNNNAPNITGTAYTTGANGDLILTCVYVEQNPLQQLGNPITSITWPGGFTGLSEDSFYGHACAYGVQTTAGSFTPTFTVAQGTHASFTIISAAFKSGSGGTAPGNGASVLLSEMHMVGCAGQTDTLYLPCPSGTSNVTVMAEVGDLTAVTDNNSNTFQHVPIQLFAPSIYYVNNPTIADGNTYKVNMTFNSSGNWDLVGLYCIGNTSGIDTAATAKNNSTLDGAGSGTTYNSGTMNGTSIVDAPSLGTSVAGDLVLDAGPIGVGPATGCVPAHCAFDYVGANWASGTGDNNSYCNGDLMSHYYAATAGTADFEYTIQPTGAGWTGMAYALKPASGTTTTTTTTSTTSTTTTTTTSSTTTTLAQAATINAASCSESDVQAAFNAATAATTIINIPAGPCAPWTTQATMNVPSGSTNLTVQGQTTVSGDCYSSACTASDSTVIVDNCTSCGSGPLWSIMTAAASSQFRLTGITLQGGTGGPEYNGQLSIHGFSQNVRVDHNHFNTASYSPANNSAALDFADWLYGVADHNVFDLSTPAIDGQNNGIHVDEGSYNNDSLGEGDQSWAAATNFGSGNFIFMENNTFNYGWVNDCVAGGRYVERYNYINEAASQEHPTQGGSDRTRGCRAVEVYNNNMVGTNGYANPPQAMFRANSGTLLVWGNSAPAGYQTEVFLYNYRLTGTAYGAVDTPNGWGACGTSFNGTGSNWDQNSNPATGYRCMDSPGVGQGDLLTGGFSADGTGTNNVTNSATGCTSSQACAWPRQASEPIYTWLNTWGQVPGYFYPDINNSTSAAFVVNSDYYPYCSSSNPSYYTCTTAFNGTVGTGSGSVPPTNPSAYPGAPNCTVQVGYWDTTNQTLYLCKTANTWTAYYTPYTYPHPLDSGATSTTTSTTTTSTSTTTSTTTTSTTTTQPGGSTTTTTSSTTSTTLPSGTLPAINSDSLPGTVGLNDSLSISNYPVSNVSFVWSFVANGGTGASEVGSLGANSAAPFTSFTSGAKTASLASYGLSLGVYQVTVQAQDASGNTSPPLVKTITLVATDFSAVQVYPNPWRSDKHAGKSVTFANLPLNSTVKLFTASGHKVKELSAQSSGLSTWDLTNDSGDKVASGVYIYLITDSQGDKVRGKVAVIK
jgi:hypothetical protein